MDTFLQLVRIDSVSLQERRLADYLARVLRDLGLEVWEDDAATACCGTAGNLCARWPGGRSGMVFCAHMDTVEPGRGVRPKVENGVVKSRGDTILGGDDKAGIAILIEAVRVLREAGWEPEGLELVFTVSEEIGLLGAKHLDFGRLRAGMGFVLDGDGPPGRIVIRAPSQDSITATIIGRAAHAGIEPEKGINAIYAAALGISRMRLGRIDEETTANIGEITGGKATNIVPERVVLRGEARSLDDAKRAKATADICRHIEEGAQRAGARAEIKVELLYPSFALRPEDPVVRAAVRAASACGLPVQLEQSGGGSDANIFNNRGIPTVNLAIGMQKVHTTEECIAVEDMETATRLVLTLIRGETACGS
ncbi:MAG: M20/M25/M40 family metallo-hydrolase [Desulfotomaculales bacterium]